MKIFFTEPYRSVRQGIRSVTSNRTVKLIMRISCLYVFLLISGVKMLCAYPTNAQGLESIRVSLESDDESFKSVLEKIKKQTGLLFSYPHENTVTYPNVTLPKNTYTVKEVLDRMLEGTSLEYRKVKNHVIISLANEMEKGDGSQGEAPSTVLATFTVTGKVTGVDTQPLPGVNIIVKGTTRGTTTDASGQFTIEVDENEILVFSFIGFKIFETPISSRSVIDVVMEEDVTALKEVEINGGYYQTTDKMKTGNIVKVTAKDIENQPVTNPLMALQGRVAGLEITPQNGTPGVAPTIRIRGTNSLRNQTVALEDNGNYPLYVIDGVPVNSAPITSWTSSFTGGGYDPLSTINPDNIESIEVLKDADATAIYGSRGANGVILITTKRNSNATERTNIDMSAYAGVGRVSKKLNVLNTSQYLQMRREALANDGLSAGPFDFDLVYWDTTRNTDWQDVLIGGSANITDFQGSISSGNKNTSFRFGGGFHKETLVFPGDFGYHRFSGQLSVNHTSSNQKFTMSVSSNYGLDNSDLFNDQGGIMGGALLLAPNAPRLYNDDGTLNWELHDLGGFTGSTWINPLSYMKNTQKTYTRNLVANTNLRYEALPGLFLLGNLGYTNLENNEEGKFPRSASSPDFPLSGSATFNDNKRASWIIEPKISYVKQIAEHELDLIVGTTWQKSTVSSNLTRGGRYVSDALMGSLEGAGEITNVRDQFAEYKYNSVYARIGYDFRQKYLLNLTGRRDGSSRFGPGNRFGNFGALGAAWIFSREKFIQDAIPFLSFGKLRGSYGVTGSDQVGDYKYYNLYDVVTPKYGGVSGLVPFAVHNSEFAWEVTNKLETALELAFAEDRVAVELSWYRNRSSNQLIEYKLPAITGFPSVLSNFDATVENSGWEAMIRGDVLNSDSWKWNISFNVSLPLNKLVKFDGIEESPYATIYKVGEPLSVRWLYTWIGVNRETGLHEFVDENNDGIINDSDKKLMNPSDRSYYGGVSNIVQYKGFELSFLFQFSSQQSSRYLPSMPGRKGINQPVDVLRRWQSEADETDVQRFSSGGVPYANFLNATQSNYNFIDASFLRLKTLAISYRIPQTWLEKVRVLESRVFFQGQNLFTITDYSGLDPETGSGLPPLRMITIGFQCKL